MKILYVYILECLDNSFYVGVTNDVGRRFIEHATGIHEKSYTFNRRPLKLVFCRQFNSPIKAIKYEKQIKKLTRAKKVALIDNDIDLLHELSKCKNATSYKTYTEAG